VAETSTGRCCEASSAPYFVPMKGHSSTVGGCWLLPAGAKCFLASSQFLPLTTSYRHAFGIAIVHFDYHDVLLVFDCLESWPRSPAAACEAVFAYLNRSGLILMLDALAQSRKIKGLSTILAGQAATLISWAENSTALGNCHKASHKYKE